MKKLLLLLISVIVIMGACAAPDGTTQTPQASVYVSAVPKPIVAEEVIPPTVQPTEEDEFLTFQIEAAEECRVSSKNTVYYFDTDNPIELLSGYEWEFLLYREDNETGMSDYLGTTGFSFQLCDRFIYVKSDVLQEDWPVGEMTRVVNLDTGVITPLGRNIDIFVPEEDGYVCYTIDGFSEIYKASPSLENPEKFDIRIPDEKEIEAQIGKLDELCTEITIINMEDEWIYFTYDVFEYEGPGMYKGNYRISINGSHLEKTDAGRFFSEDE